MKQRNSKPVQKTYCAQCGVEIYAFSYIVVDGKEIIVCAKCRRDHVVILSPEQIAAKEADERETERTRRQNDRQGKYTPFDDPARIRRAD
jgi:ribosome-binding protein aMBF1 (putative translation factor)